MINKFKNIYKNNLKFNWLIYILIFISTIAYAITYHITKPHNNIDRLIYIFIGWFLILLISYQYNKLKILKKVVKIKNEKENKTYNQ